MDEEKYGPIEYIDFSSASTTPEETDPEPEYPDPPSMFGWLTPKLYKGTSDRENRLLQWLRKLFS
jgi:hypothetical protein